MLKALPPPILRVVLLQLDIQDWWALARVSRAVKSSVLPFLYRTLSIQMPSSDPLLGIRSFVHHHGEENVKDRLKLVRRLEFAGDRPRGCHRSRSQRALQKSYLFPKSLEISIQLILDGLCMGRLESFSWCFAEIPRAILGIHGYIPNYQSGIQSLKLSASGVGFGEKRRHGTPLEGNVDGLMKLKHLRSLVWTGIHSQRQISVLNACIKQNAAHLETLELGFAEHAQIDAGSISCLEDRSAFPNLQRFSLDGLSFLRTDGRPISALTSPCMLASKPKNRKSAIALARSLLHPFPYGPQMHDLS